MQNQNLKNKNINIKISYILAYYLDAICEHIIFVENLKFTIMKLLTLMSSRMHTSFKGGMN